MPKNWKILPKTEDSFIETLPGYSPVVLQLLFNRGLKTKEKVEVFLNPDFNVFTHDPLLFNNMDAAVERIIGHVKAGNKIMVYGDYDADGVTASALLVDTLTILKGKVDIYIPYRVTEGYGLNKAALDEINKQGVKLIITVDNGIRNQEEIEYARNLGLEIIITDHHVPPENKDELPDCLIINPLVSGEKYPYKSLSGAAVAYKLACALIDKSTLPERDKNELKERILDLVAIGTVADCVSLLGENRVLVKKGLKVLNKTKRIGLLELIRASGLKSGRLNAWNIGFQIAPRLNAAGRLDHANTAFELLITRDMNKARDLSRSLNESNSERQKITDKIFKQADEQISKLIKDNKIIIAVSPSVNGRGKAWNEGVVGLVASRLCDKYYLPTLVITSSEKDIKGSGRSIKGFNLIDAIEDSRAYLDKYGGHALAAGVTIKDKNPEMLNKFSKALKTRAKERLADVDLKPVINIEAEIKAEDINERLIEEIELFSPFGQDNPRPKFAAYGLTILDIINMGLDSQHIKLRIKSDQSKALTAIGFNQSEAWQDLKIGDKIDIACYLEINEFNGRREVQMKIIDIKCSK